MYVLIKKRLLKEKNWFALIISKVFDETCAPVTCMHAGGPHHLDNLDI